MPATREAQDIYLSACRLDKELRELCKTQSPTETEPSRLRARIRDELEELLLHDLDYSVEKDIEQLLWKTIHYRVIEDFRKKLRSIASTAVTPVQEGRNIDSSSPSSNFPKKDLRMLLNASFRQFLIESVGFYLSILRRMRIEYDLDIVEKIVFHRLGTEPFDSSEPYSSIERDGLSNGHIISNETKDKARFICHRFLLSLGDLARYKEFYAERKEKNYSTAKLFYRLASQLTPDSGNPHNQLAVVESQENQQLGAVERYLKSLLIRRPFVPAKENLLRILSTYANRSDGFNQFDDVFLSFLSRLFSSPEHAFEQIEIERVKTIVLNSFKNVFTKKQVNHASDMMQIFMIAIGSLELASGQAPSVHDHIGHPAMISPFETLLSELIITICNTTAYRLGTVGSSHNAFTSTAAPLMQHEPIKQVSKFLSSIKVVVKWLKTRVSSDRSSIGFLGENVWRALGDALNALSAIASSIRDDSAALLFDSVLVEDVDLATFTPISPIQSIRVKSKEQVEDLDDRDDHDARSSSSDNGSRSTTSVKARNDADVDPVKLMLRLICGDRHNEEEQSLRRIQQIVHSARDLCKVMDRNLYHATRVSPDGVEYDYFAVTKLPPTMIIDSPARVSVARDFPTSSPSRPDVMMRSPRRPDEDSEDLVDDTELFAPRRFNPAAVVGSGIQKRQASPSHPTFQQPIPPPLRSAPITSMNMGSADNTEWVRRMSQPDPLVTHVMNSAAQVARNQTALNRNIYRHDDEYEDNLLPPRFARSRSGDGRVGGAGDVQDHSQSTMRFLELEGNGLNAPGYGGHRNIAPGMRPPGRFDGGDGWSSMEGAKYGGAIGNQRYDFGSGVFGGHGATGFGNNSGRIPPGLTGTELSWASFGQLQPSANQSSQWYRPPGSFHDGDGSNGRYPSSSLPSTTTSPPVSDSMSLSWLQGVSEQNPRVDSMTVNGPFGRRSSNANGLWS